jgi:NCAIR mutase (PurE)-related protein
MSEDARYDSDLRGVLERLAAGDIELDEAVRRLRLFRITQLGDFARLDANRDVRKGVPEVIYAAGKDDADLEAIALGSLVERGFALVSRLEPARSNKLEQALAAAARTHEELTGLKMTYHDKARTLRAYASAYRPPEQRGSVGLLTAGTSDIPVAEEAALMATHMGCGVERGYDVGVAGLHRLVEPLGRMTEANVDVLVVCAGMEGALPSVVAGLVDVPVIGVPTSTGYGLGGDGHAALYSMLQSCSPGVVTVNIDNGVGAGVAAALIARRARK